MVILRARRVLLVFSSGWVHNILGRSVESQKKSYYMQGIHGTLINAKQCDATDATCNFPTKYSPT